MSDTDVNVKISGNASELKNATDQAKSAVASASSGMKDSLQGLKGSFDSLTASMNKMSAEMKAASLSNAAAQAQSAASIKTAISGVQQGVAGMVDEVKGGMAKLQGVFEGVAKGMLLLTAVVAGGSAFKSMVKDTVDYVSANVKLGKQLSISATEAGVLSVALGNIGSSGEAYGDSVTHLNKQLKSNEEGLQAMGLKTRDANGNLRSSNDLMQDSIKLVGEYKSGIDQTQASMVLFGKGAEESLKFQRLNNEVMEEAKRKSEALGLTITQGNVEANKKYKIAMNDLHDVFQGINNAIAEQLIPRLTALAQMFSEYGPQAVEMMRAAMQTYLMIQDELKASVIALYETVRPIFDNIGDAVKDIFGDGGEGPTAVEIFKNALSILQVVVIGFRVGFQEVCTAIGAAISQVIVSIQGWVNVAIAAYQSIKSLSLGPLQSAWKANNMAIEADLQRSANKMVDIAAKGAEDIQKALMGSTMPARDNTPTAKFVGGGTRTMGELGKPKSGGGGSDKASQLQNAEYALIKAEEDAKKALIKENQKEQLKDYEDQYARHKITIEAFYADKARLIKSDFNLEMESVRKLMEENNKKKPKDEVERVKIKTELIKLTGQLALLEKEQANAATDNNRKLNAELEKQRQLKQQLAIDAIKQNGLQVVELEKISSQQALALKQVNNTKMLQMDKDREQKIYEILRKAASDRLALAENDPDKQAQINAELEQLERDHVVKIAQIRKDIVVDAQKDNIALYDTMSNGLTGIFTSLTNHNKTLKSSFKDLFDSVFQMLVKLQAQKLTESIMGSMNGGAGGGGGGSMFSGIGSMLSGLMSFDVGTNYVPGDMVAQIHKGEAIVPAKYNNPESMGGVNKNTTVHNQFIVSSPPDRRTQMQIANMAGNSIQTAMRRNN